MDDNNLIILMFIQSFMIILQAIHTILKKIILPPPEVVALEYTIPRQKNLLRFKNWFQTFLDHPQTTKRRWIKYFRMTKQSFLKLVHHIEPFVFPYPESGSGAQRADIRFLLGATLMRLSRGTHYDVSGERFGLSKSTINKYHPRVMDAIWRCLHTTLTMPTTEEELKKTAQEFQDYCQLPNCIGVIDGTHIPIEAPERSKNLVFF